MKDRILQFLESVKISPAEFADKIGVQRSSMSHILNGRNYPSAAFIQKMLQAYPLLNSRWLMIGDGTMNMDSQETKHSQDVPGFSTSNELKIEPGSDAGLQAKGENAAETRSLFFPESESEMPDTGNYVSGVLAPEKESKLPNQDEPLIQVSSGEQLKEERSIATPTSLPARNVDDKEIEQVLFFYKDKTFSIYRPS